MNNPKLESKIKSILARPPEKPESMLRNEMLLHDACDLPIKDIVAEMENTFAVKLEPEDKLETVGDVIAATELAIKRAAGRKMLDAFYTGHQAKTPEEKVLSLREYFIREPMMVTVTSVEDELNAIEVYVLMHLGF